MKLHNFQREGAFTSYRFLNQGVHCSSKHNGCDKVEKSKAYSVFMNVDNTEIFLCSCDEDLES